MTTNLTPLSSKVMLKCGILEEYHDKDFTDYFAHPDKWKELKSQIDEWNQSNPHRPIIITEKHLQEGRKVLERVITYSRNLHIARKKGISLLLAGNNGTGKTLLGVSILKQAIRRGFTAQMTSLEGIIRVYTDGWTSIEDRKLFDQRIRNVDFLLIDDVGKEYKAKNSELTEVMFDNLIRYRVGRRKPFILTTNTDPESMLNRYGNSLMSNLEGKAIKLKVVGFDYRKVILSKNLWKELTNDE